MDWTVLAADDRALTENDASLVLTARVRTPEGSYSVLLTGDLEQDAARRMLGAPGVPEQVDVLKVSHHGARNGGLDTAQALHPRLSLISVGADNTYGHPHPVIARELARYGPVVRTDLLGTAVLSLREGSLVTTGLGP